MSDNSDFSNAGIVLIVVVGALVVVGVFLVVTIYVCCCKKSDPPRRGAGGGGIAGQPDDPTNANTRQPNANGTEEPVTIMASPSTHSVRVEDCEGEDYSDTSGAYNNNHPSTSPNRHHQHPDTFNPNQCEPTP